MPTRSRHRQRRPVCPAIFRFGLGEDTTLGMPAAQALHQPAAARINTIKFAEEFSEMNRTKPLSMEEKENRIHALLQEHNTFYTLKEIEKLAPKVKGVVAQSVKEVLETLVADNRIKEQKIGSSTYFWSFMSDILIQKENHIKSLMHTISTYKETIAALTSKISEAEEQRIASPKRTRNLRELYTKQQEIKDAEAEITFYEQNNPNILRALKDTLHCLVNRINTHTHNIYVLKQYLCEHFNMDGNDFNTSFNISPDMDSIVD
ncbi:hypothetical protein NEDG_00509 [Nematocida displodere]|uniref:Meiotic nuclear division protein 1 n=1 Tax=Nematocida displodere TaxID=1805483 RepID=A0A177EJ78_9MICR|nr:hypothetical protein NEDG_00509 [Nematocida displodere]